MKLQSYNESKTAGIPASDDPKFCFVQVPFLFVWIFQTTLIRREFSSFNEVQLARCNYAMTFLLTKAIHFTFQVLFLSLRKTINAGCNRLSWRL
jgi:hypothetical protein